MSLASAKRDIHARYGSLIEQAAEAYGVNPDLIASVIAVESRGNPAAVSEAGAAGLMQLMPDTANDLGVRDRLDPAQSIDAGTKYLAGLIERTGSERMGLAAYHGGIGNIEAAGGRIPPGFTRTAQYVEDVTGTAANDKPGTEVTDQRAERFRQAAGMSAMPEGVRATAVTDPNEIAKWHQAAAVSGSPLRLPKMPDDPQAVMDFASQQESNFLKRYVVGGGQQVVYGFASMVPQSMTVLGAVADKVADKMAGRDVSFDGLARAGLDAQKWLEENVAVENPDFALKTMGAIGAMLGFLGPGLVTARGAGVLLAKTSMGKAALKKAADALGLGVMSTLESAVELGGSIQERMDAGESPSEALQNAQEVFWYNLPVLLATNAPYFHPASRAARALIEAPLEGGQERWQAVVQDVVAGRGNWSDFLDWHKNQEETLIGALIGGGAAAVLPGDPKPPKPKITLDEMAAGLPEVAPAEGQPVEPDARRTLLEAHAAQDDAIRQQATQRIGPEIDRAARLLRLQDAVGNVLGSEVDLAERLAPEAMAEVQRDLDAVFAQPSEAEQRHAASRLVQKVRGMLLGTVQSQAAQVAGQRSREREGYWAARAEEQRRRAAIREQRAAAAQVASEGATAAPAPGNRAERRAAERGAGKKPTTPVKKPAVAPAEALEAVRESLEAETGALVVLSTVDEAELAQVATAAADAINEPDPVTQARKFDDAVEQAKKATRKPRKPKADATPKVAPATQEVAPAVESAQEPVAMRTARPPKNISQLPTVAISTDPERFQVRSDGGKSGFDEEFVANAVANFDPQAVNPIEVWQDPKDGKFYVIDGHHTLEILKRAGQEIAAIKVFKGTEAEAIAASKKRNDMRRGNDLLAQAATVRAAVESGQTRKQVDADAKQLYGRNAATVRAIAALNPKGRLMSALKAFSKAADEDTQEIRKIAKWVGAVRMVNPELTDAHEGEMFDDLKKNIKSRGKQYESEAAYKSFIYNRVNNLGGFDFSQPLNLHNAVARTAFQGKFDDEVGRAKEELRQAVANHKERESAGLEAMARKENPLSLRDYMRMMEKYDAEVAAKSAAYQELMDRRTSINRNDSGEQALFDLPGSESRDMATARKLVRKIGGRVVKIKMPLSLKIVNDLAAAFGAEVTYVEVLDKNGQPDPRAFNGISVSPDRIVLNVNAEKPLLWVASHEIGHNILRTDPKIYAEIVKIISRDSAMAVAFGMPNNRQEYRGYSTEESFDEFVADTIAQVIQSETFLSELKSRNPSMFGKLVNMIRDTLVAVQRFMSSNGFDMSRYFTDFAQVENNIAKLAADVAVKRTSERVAQARATEQQKADAAGERIMFDMPPRQPNDTDDMEYMRQRQYDADSKSPQTWRQRTSSLGQWLRTSMVDEAHPLYVQVRHYLKTIGVKAANYDWHKRPDLVLKVNRSWNAIANHSLQTAVYAYNSTGQAAEKLSDGLAVIINRHKIAPWIESGHIQHFWQAADHVAHYEKLKDDYFKDPELDPEGYASDKDDFGKYQRIYDYYSKLHPEWVAAVKELTGLANAQMRRVQQSGILDDAQYDRITKFSVYAPMNLLDMAERESQSYGHRQTPRDAKPAYSRDTYKVGAVRIDPFTGLIRNIYRLEHLIHMHDTKMSVIDFAADINEKGGDAYDFAHKIPPKAVPIFKPTASLLSQMGIRLSKNDTYRFEYKKAVKALSSEYGLNDMEKGSEEYKDARRAVHAEAADIATEKAMPVFEKNLSDMGLTDALNGMQSIWTVAHVQDEGVIAVRRDGKMEYYKVDEQVFEVFAAADRKLPEIMRYFSAQTALLRSGAVLTPEFMNRNIMRDMGSIAIMASGMVNNPADAVLLPIRVMQGLSESFRHGPVWREWILQGGAHAELVAGDMMEIRKNLDDFVRGRGVDYMKYAAKHPAKFVFHSHPIRAMQYLSQRFEQATRLAVYKKSVDHYLSKGHTLEEARFRAIVDSRQASVDFNVAGRHGRILNQMIPFFNAGIQGQDKLIRTMFVDPGKSAAWLKAVMMITVPSMALYAMNWDKEWYQDLPTWLKNSCWIFSPDKGKTVITIPKPFELGMAFGSLPERLYDQYRKVDPTAAKRWLEQWTDMVAVFSPSEMMGPIAFTANQLGSNYDSFRDAPIVPEMMKKLEDRAQYTSATSEVAVWLGEVTPGDGISPLQFDYMVKGTIGSSGQYLLDAASAIVFGVDKMMGGDRKAQRPAQPLLFDAIPANTPLLRAFFKDMPVAYSAPKERFYGMYERALEANNTYREYSENNPDKLALADLIRRRGMDVAMYPLLSKTASDLNTIGRSVRAVQVAPAEMYDSREKDRRIQILYQQANDAVRLAVKRYEEAMRDPKVKSDIKTAADLLESSARSERKPR